MAVKAVLSGLQHFQIDTKSRNRLSGLNTSMESIKLPSHFQPGDKVGLHLLIDTLDSGRTAEITKVSFLPGKVRYDLQTTAGRLANVDSALIEAPIQDSRSVREIVIDELINLCDPKTDGENVITFLKKVR